jgi:signal transduction histidine kinase
LQVQTHFVTSPPPQEAQEAEIDRLYRAERTMLLARWVAVVFSFLQIITFYRPYPRYVLTLALAIVVVMAIGNTMFSYRLRRAPAANELRHISFVTLTFDVIVVSALIWIYTFDPDTAIWAVMYILPLGGAIRFQMRGAMYATAGVSLGYALREVFGAYHYDNEFLFSSITFRCGIAFLIAYVAGSTTRELLAGRNRVEKANRELFELNRSMREFVSIASHDMRTPVSVISGLSNTIVRDGDTMSEPQKRELIQVIHRRSKSLDRLVNDLLATSSIDAGIVPHRAERIDVRDLLQDAVQNTEAGFVEVLVENGAVANADPEHVRRIIGNLLSNAARYGEPPVSITASRATPWIVIEVADHGPGVPKSFVPRLYEKFARAPETARSVEGTGLGLSIVRGLVQQNGGTVTYEPADHGGARFVVRLPEWGPTVTTGSIT